MKKFIMIIFVLFLAWGFFPFVSANSLQFIAQPGDEVSLFFTCIKNNGNLDSANLTYSIYYPNTTIFINNQSLIEYSIGKFTDIITVPQTLGNYFIIANCDFTNVSQTKNYSQVFQVENKEKYVESALDVIFGSFLIFLLGILLFWLGSYSKNVLFFFASGLWFIGSAVGISFTEVNLPMTAFFLLIAIVAIYHGIGKTLSNKKEIKNEKMRRLRDE
jgi:hypothetical protein